MTASAESFAAGMPVEVGQIQRELKKLWQQGGEVMTRASLINLAIYSEAPGSLEQNTQLIAAITREHACRAIVIAAEPAAAEDHVESWISAHCHVSRAGQKHVCSEQISFHITGCFAGLLPNIVFSHLDSDLPFYLWWQGEFRPPMDPQLWSWVDRVLYDSRLWSDPEVQLQLLAEAQKEANDRMVLCDLNWTRLVQVRLALAQFFDHPRADEQLAALQRVEVVFGSGARSTALLLAGWLAAQLGWGCAEADEDEQTVQFTSCSGERISVGLHEAETSQPIARCSLFTEEIEFRVTHPVGADLLHVSTRVNGDEPMRQLMPAGGNDPVALVSEELMRGGRHHVYLRAIDAVRQLL